MPQFINTEKLVPVKQFDCPGCGNALSITNPRTKVVGCQYCGSELDVASDDYQVLQELDNPKKYKPYSFIKVGQFAAIKGKVYQVISRTRWRQDYSERWQEDGQVGYSKEYWIYDEWLLMSEQRTYFYLVEDREGYRISKEIIPKFASFPDLNRMRMDFDNANPRHYIQEVGEANVIYFEGESNYVINRDDKIFFASYVKSNEYITEWRIDKETDTVKEIEFFSEIPIREEKVLEIFSVNEEIQTLLDKKKNVEFVMKTFIGATIVSLLLLFSSWGNGNVLTEQSYTIDNINEVGVTGEGIELEKGLYRIELNTNLYGGISTGMSSSAEAFVSVYFLDKDSAAIKAVNGDFYNYSGYDGEYWTESNTSTSDLVRVKEAGIYYPAIFAKSETPGISGTTTLSIRKGLMLSRYFLILILLFGILALVYRSKHKNFIKNEF